MAITGDSSNSINRASAPQAISTAAAAGATRIQEGLGKVNGVFDGVTSAVPAHNGDVGAALVYAGK